LIHWFDSFSFDACISFQIAYYNNNNYYYYSFFSPPPQNREVWLGWIPGFYSLVIACEVYLMLPMFGGAEKIFRKVLVPLFKLEEYLMLRDAFFVKKRIWSELDADRSIAMRTAIAKLFAEEDDASANKTRKNDLLESYAGILRTNKKSGGAEPNEATNLV